MNRLAYKIVRYTRWISLGVLAAALCVGARARAGAKFDADAASGATIELAGLQDRFSLIADEVTPSIVAISAVGADIPPSALRIDGAVDGPQLAAALDRVARTVGTGFIIDAEGYIITAEHVISEAEQIWITTDDKKVYPAMVVGSDPRSDLAVLKIPAHGLKPVRFADGDAVRRGQWTLTLGNPYGLATGGELSMSVGVVSATNRALSRLSAQENRLYTNLIQTTAEINPGNSGGPLFDLEGRVIGVNAAVVLPQKNTNGLGFAFSINDDLLQRIQRMKAGDVVLHAYMGVSVSNSTSASTPGARVDSVMADGPSAPSGLAVGDIVVKINESAINGSDAFARTVALLGVNQKVTMKVLRDGSQKELTIQTGLRPSSKTAVCRTNQKFYFAGMLIGTTPDGFRVQSIASSSPFRKQGIEQGSILVGVGGQKAASLSDLLTLLNDAGEGSCKIDKAAHGTGAHAAL